MTEIQLSAKTKTIILKAAEHASDAMPKHLGMPMADYNIVDQVLPDPDSLTYSPANPGYISSWKRNGFVPDQPTPSMDNKDTPSPPIVTQAEFDTDWANGHIRIGNAIYGTKKGIDKD